MDKQVVFKTSPFGGFEKKAVLDYIYKLNEESATVQTHLREQMESINSARATLEDSLRRANEKMITVQKELDKAKSELSAQKANASELNAENEELRNHIEMQTEQISQMRDDLNTLSLQTEELKAENADLRKQKQEFDQAVSSVGKIILDARFDAEQIVDEANKQAQTTRLEAENEAEILKRIAEEEAEERVQVAQKRAEEINAKSDAEYSAIIEKAKQEANSLVRSAEQNAGAIKNQADMAAKKAAKDCETFIFSMEEMQTAMLEMMQTYSQKAQMLKDTVTTAKDALEKREYTELEFSVLQDSELVISEAIDFSAEEETCGEEESIAEVFFR